MSIIFQNVIFRFLSHNYYIIAILDTFHRRHLKWARGDSCVSKELSGGGGKSIIMTPLKNLTKNSLFYYFK